MSVTWNAKAADPMLDMLDKRLHGAALYLLAVANRTIPIETGQMMRSGAVSRPKRHERIVSYNTVYAVRQHEDVRLRHATGRRARWLAQALDEQRSRIVQFIGKGSE